MQGYTSLVLLSHTNPSKKLNFLRIVFIAAYAFLYKMFTSPSLSNFVSKLLDLSCPCDVLISKVPFFFLPMLTRVYCWRRQQWGHAHQKLKVEWSDQSLFFFCMAWTWHVHCLPEEHPAPGCTMGRGPVGGGCLMLWAMFFLETVGPAFHVDVILTHYLPKHVHTLPWNWHSLMAVSFLAG